MAFINFTPRLWRQGVRLMPLQRRCHLHLPEHQSFKLLEEFGISVPRGEVVTTAAEVGQVIHQLGRPCIVKQQATGNSVHSAQVAQNASAGEALASKILQRRIQSLDSSTEAVGTGLYVAERIDFDKTWYISMSLDRENYATSVTLSQSTDSAPGRRHSYKMGLDEGITSDLLCRISKHVGASPKEERTLKDILVRLHKLFVAKEATLLEINQVALGPDGTFTCLDANLNFDAAAEERQRELFAMRDTKAEVPEEVEAQRYGLVYIKMDGLAMATNDAIALYGGRSLNFLDAGGQATKQTMQKAFEIILRDERVKVILVNIYGGIIKCDMIAESIIGAAQELGPLRVPLVVRLQGTNSAEGLKIVEDANLGFHVQSDFGKAAETAVQLSKAAVS
ncbi:succinyl-CoA synthetase-like protein [Fusarium avenaceum]|nr:succinyl-CoA synthetase-like protein [Fusarium avenaceum]